MSITKELREYADIWNTDRAASMAINSIANHIDAAHERELREEHTKGYNDGFDEGFASADDWDVDHADELAEHGWAMLPRDADGVPIHVGDVLTDGKHTYTVTSIAFNSCNVVVYGCTETNKNEWPIDQTSKMHHVEHVTVEDVLREFALACEDAGNAGPEVERLAAEYADRIREVLCNAQ